MTTEQIADTARPEGGKVCAGLVAPAPRQKRKTVPEMWKAKADAWFAHVADCPDCSRGVLLCGQSFPSGSCHPSTRPELRIELPFRRPKPDPKRHNDGQDAPVSDAGTMEP